MNTFGTRFYVLLLISGLFSVAISAQDAFAQTEHIVNGDFETGTLSGWTATTTGAALAWTVNDGTIPPTGFSGLLSPISGNFDVYSSQGGPSMSILSEPFIVPAGINSATLSWKDRIQNFAAVFSDPIQEARVLIKDAAGVVTIAEIFSTNPGDPLIQLGPNTRSFDITTLLQGLQGQTIRVSFEQRDNFGFFNLSLDDISLITNSGTSGSTGHEPPTIGRALDGVRQVVECGLSIDDECQTVTSPYHEEMELLQMLTSPHTISNTIHCEKGVQYCNYVAVGFMGLTDDFNNPVMTVSASKDHQGTWTLGWFDPNDYISDPSDAVPADIVFVPQIIDNRLLGTSFTIDFKNKDTGQLKLGIQVRDSYNGVRNFYFNEGVEFIDSDAYPQVETAYEKPLEVEPLCFGNNNPDRNSCAFTKIKDWATQNAEDALRQMLENEYSYK